MALRFIMGNSGSGKSFRGYNEIIAESLRYPERNFLIIVPEQFTMQIQKELVMLHPRRGILNIDVLSFQRLAYRIFEEVGSDQRMILEDTGKNLLLRKIAIEQSENLQVLGRNLQKTGYINELKSLISEFSQYDIAPQQLDQMLEFAQGKPQLYYKLKDVQIIYQAFQDKLRQTYITAEEVLEVLCGLVADSKLLKNSSIFLDEFTGFTPIQQKLLRELLQHCRQVTVALTIDTRETPWQTRGIHELFYMSKKTAQLLSKIARDIHVPVEDPIMQEKGRQHRFTEAPALNFLEQHFLRPYPASYEGEQQEISLHCAKNAVEEAHFAARTIRRLIMESGYRYQDIAVITGDMASYGSHIRKVFELYGIPAFIDETKKILLNPFIEFIRSALELVYRNYSYESVFRYLRTGLCGLTAEEVDKVENYVLASGIRGVGKWEKPWQGRTRKLSEDEVQECEVLRVRIMENLTPFAKVIKSRKTTGQEKTQALYQLIAAYDMQTKLEVYRRDFEAEGKLDTAKEYEQIYEIVIHLLEKVVELLGTEKMSLKEYTEILEAGFEEAKVGVIPPTADRIVVGDIERTRLKNIKALIFLGLNDGWVPGTGGRTGIFSELDRETLKDSGVELAPGSRENGYIQRFYLYLNMTKPGQRLYLSYSKSRTDGGAMRPSYIVGRILRMFPGMKVIDEDICADEISRIGTPGNGMRYLIEGMQQLGVADPGAVWKELYSWYFSKEEWAGRLIRLVEAAFYSRSEQGLGRKVAQALYGTVLENSVSRLERFAGCAFAHFALYGLQLSEREVYEFQAVDMGNIIHKVIELFSGKLEQSEYTWFDVPGELQEQWTRESVRQVSEEYGSSILSSTARNAYIIQRMERIMKRTVWALCEQVRAGRFVPQNYEVSFNLVENLEAVNITLNDAEKMKLRGRIDRVDTCEDEQQVYVKVIDYKSGSTEFDMVALYYGLQLQLVVYLNAAVEMEKRIHPDKEIVPAGIFYYRALDPMLDGSGQQDHEEIHRQILKKLKLSGLVNEHPDIVRSMDEGIGKDSDIIPVSYNKDGSPSRYASVADTEKFKQLSAYVNEKIRSIGTRIMTGETAAIPYERKSRTACEYCEYKEVCGFDPTVPGTRKNRLKEYKTEEIWNKINEEVD